MERRIKFRAWDGDKKEMHLPEYADNSVFHISADGDILETHEYGYERHELTNPRPKSWVLTEFTGQQESDLNDVYEGDILKSIGNDVRIVIYNNFTAAFELQNINDPEDLIPCRKDNLTYRTIIGNIFKNPELLAKPNS